MAARAEQVLSDPGVFYIPYNRLPFSASASITSSNGIPFNSEIAVAATMRLAGSFRSPGSDPSTGLSVSTIRQSSGRCLTSFCFWRERTTDGGIEKK